MGKSLGRKIIATVGILSIVLFLCCLLNASAWSIIEKQNAQVAANFEEYKKAAESADKTKMKEAQENVEYMLERCHVRRHIMGGANRTLISAEAPLRLCRTGT